MSNINHRVVAGSTVLIDDDGERYMNSWCEGDMGEIAEKEFTTVASRWPVGTKILVQVPECPTEECSLDVEYQDDDGCCSGCGFDWKRWVEENY